jgi:aspartate--ammonia ligase
MSTLIIPEGYKNLLDFSQTEKAIKLIKDSFQQNLSSELKLKRVTAPLFVVKGTGINDDLNGIERKVAFQIKDMNNTEAEVVNSLAKWKRMAIGDYGILPGYGIYTDMNAIRPDEELDNLHSLYVDQWDWELAINKDNRNPEFLKKIVRKIFEAIKRTEYAVEDHYPQIKSSLPNEITFLHSEDLCLEFPDLSPRQREYEMVKRHGAIFVIGIGAALPGGEAHDGRAPDYDDWITDTGNGHKGLNGDIILWNPVLKNAFEISSMGIRVDEHSLLKQLEITGNSNRKSLLFHQRLLKGELPYTIGGGIGQSRLCMYYLRKAHIGEVQTSIWPPEMIEECRKNDIMLF